MKSKACILAAISISCFLGTFSSCCYIPENIEVAYQPSISCLSKSALKDVIVDIRVIDSRRGGKEVGLKKGENGIHLAAIKLSNNLCEEISKVLTTELKQYGCTIGEGHHLVEVDVQKFSNDFQQGFFADKGNAEFFISVTVRKPDGMIAYAKTILGFGENRGIWVHSGENAKISLNNAFNDALSKLLTDPAFIQALR